MDDEQLIPTGVLLRELAERGLRAVPPYLIDRLIARGLIAEPASFGNRRAWRKSDVDAVVVALVTAGYYRPCDAGSNAGLFFWAKPR